MVEEEEAWCHAGICSVVRLTWWLRLLWREARMASDADFQAREVVSFCRLPRHMGLSPYSMRRTVRASGSNMELTGKIAHAGRKLSTNGCCPPVRSTARQRERCLLSTCQLMTMTMTHSAQGIHKKVHGKAKTLGRAVNPERSFVCCDRLITYQTFRDVLMDVASRRMRKMRSRGLCPGLASLQKEAGEGWDMSG